MATAAEAEDLETLDVGDEGDGENYAEGEEEGDDDELEQMKKKLKEMEGEAEKLRKIHEETEENAENGDDEAAAERDSRSVYIGNVDYSVTPEDLQEHFEPAGSVEKITIPTDKFKNPKGYAYIEFSDASAVEDAVGLSDTELKGRLIKVVAKRTNVPGMGRGKGKGGRGGKGGGRGYGKGYGKGKGGYRPYYRPRYGRGRYRPY